MKKLKYRFLKAIAVALKCEDLINWDEYNDCCPHVFKSSEDHQKFKNGLIFNDDVFIKNMFSTYKERTPFLTKIKELGFKRPGMEKQFEHYEEKKC